MLDRSGNPITDGKTDERASWAASSYDPGPEREITRGALARGLLWLLSFVIGGILMFIAIGRLEGTVLTQSVFPSLIALAGTALGFYFGAEAAKSYGGARNGDSSRITETAPTTSEDTTSETRHPGPGVAKVEPNSGTKNGGTPVTIEGTGFINGAKVEIGGVAATDVTVTGGSTITAATPPHPEGTVDVTVTNPGGEPGLLIDGFTYTSS